VIGRQSAVFGVKIKIVSTMFNTTHITAQSFFIPAIFLRNADNPLEPKREVGRR